MTTSEEKYSRAVRTSDLALTDDSVDIDALIAIGWLREGLACMLWRLKVEYDTVGRRAAEHAANDLTARVLALASLRTLEESKQALAGFAVAQAIYRAGDLKRMGYVLTSEEAVACVPFILDWLLEPFCYRCTGRGSLEAFGKPRIICPACNGAQRRKMPKPTGDGQRWLLEHLQAELERKEAVVARQVRRFIERNPV